MSAVNINHKVCNRCAQLLPCTNYYMGKRGKRTNICRDCNRDKDNRSKKKLATHHRARYKLNNAVASGKVVRQDCEVCGNPKTHGHHDDYSKPLEVRWLCITHHAEWHKHNEPKE